MRSLPSNGFLVILALNLFGCGVKTDPVPYVSTLKKEAPAPQPSELPKAGKTPPPVVPK